MNKLFAPPHPPPPPITLLLQPQPVVDTTPTTGSWR